MKDGNCEECLDKPCLVCLHMACPVCINCCDHPDCLVWDKHGHGTKTHECIYEPCSVHGDAAEGVTDSEDETD